MGAGPKALSSSDPRRVPTPMTNNRLKDCGSVERDADGDGRILGMRIPDPNPSDPGRHIPTSHACSFVAIRLKTGATYYRLLPEGRIDNYDGVTIGLQPTKERLHFNRNFPASWRQDHEQQGAGPFPASEPETRNVMAFITNHANITGAGFHTYSGVLPASLRRS